MLRSRTALARTPLSAFACLLVFASDAKTADPSSSPAAGASPSPSASVAKPAVVGTLRLPDGQTARLLTVGAGSALLVTRASSGDRLLVIDTSKPSSSSIAAQLELGAAVNALAVSGERAFLATSDEARELIAVDVTTRGSPRIAGAFDAPDAPEITALAADAARLYAGTRSGELHVLDVSSPENAVGLGVVELGGAVTGIAISGKRLFVGLSGGKAALVELDVSDPERPVEKAFLALGGGENATAIAESGGNIVVARANADGSSDLFAVRARGTSLEKRGSLRFAEQIHGVALHLNKAFVGAGARFEVIDIRDAAKPVRLSSLAFEKPVVAIDFGRDEIFVATPSSLEIIDPKLHYEVAVFGDSNTARCWFHPRGACEDKWSELADAATPVYALHNFARQGATTCKAAGHLPIERQLNNAIKKGIRFDVGVIALGTNDLYFFPEIDPARVLECYEKLSERVESLGMMPLIALTPPMYPPAPAVGAKVERLNGMIRANSGSFHLDFFSGFRPELYMPDDGVHFEREGQEMRKRAFLGAMSR